VLAVAVVVAAKLRPARQFPAVAVVVAALTLLRFLLLATLVPRKP
jgi:hypothetical protein